MLVAVASWTGAGSAAPGTLRLRPLAGEQRGVVVKPEETLLDIAHDHRVGFEAVARLNRGVDEWIPEPGTIVRLPTRYVIPDVVEDGLVINVPEMRLYDFRGEGEVEVYAAAVGDADDPTPVGEFRIGEKRVDPVWTVPSSIRAEKPELPAQVPPGPDNPLGDRWMTLGTSSYGIHGTNIRWSIGRMATHGCVRLYEDEVRRLFDRTPTGTRVQVVYQLFKWGEAGGALYLEAHPDRYDRVPAPLATALATPRALGLLDAVDLEQVWKTIDDALGIPVRVGTLPARPSPVSTSKRPS